MIRFVVYGRPAPQGSMRAFNHAKTGAVVTTCDNRRTKPWKQEIAATAIALQLRLMERPKPVAVELDFYFARPKTAKKRIGVTVRPDADKLTRAVFDAITGILIEDDAQIIEYSAAKHYGEPERVEITIAEVTAETLMPPRRTEVAGVGA